jgi:hypothetical protein
LSFTVGYELVDEVVVEIQSAWVHSPTYFALWSQKNKIIELIFFRVLRVTPP